MGDDSEVPVWFRAYPAPDITPGEFEEWVAEIFASIEPAVENLQVTLHDRITGPDGSYDFDATIRYRFAGLDFLVLAEAKAGLNPIKREQVQVLHSKAQSVGAHKGVMISTSAFQRGAMEFAKVHGIALVVVTEGRFTYETRGATPPPLLSREEALRRFDLPAFVGHCYSPGDDPDTTSVTLISTRAPEYIVSLLLAVPKADGSGPD